MAAKKTRKLAKLASLTLAFWLIFSLSAFSLTSSGSIQPTTLSTAGTTTTSIGLQKTIPRFPQAGIKYTTNQTAANEKCNFNEPACTQFPYNCICRTNENESLQVSITYDWNGIFPPGTPMCVWAVPETLPQGASAPTVQGIGQVTSTLTWTPSYCQAGLYYETNPPDGVSFFIGKNCTFPNRAYDYKIEVLNADRQPSIHATPAGPIEVNMRQPVHIDVVASDPDTLECTDAQNKDVLALTQIQGQGAFVDNGNGGGGFNWTPMGPTTTSVAFRVNDGKGALQDVFVNIDVNAVPADPVQPEPQIVKKNRYISFKPTNPGIMTALRVKLTSLNHPNPPYSLGPSPHDFSGFEGQYRWVGPPQQYQDAPLGAFMAASLQCDPYYMDWSTVGLANAFGEEIVPSSVYEVQAFPFGCSVNDTSCYSTPLPVETGRWGDIFPSFSTPGGTTQPDALDIANIVKKFKSMPGAPSKTLAQLQPALVNPANLIDAIDISRAVQAFQGNPYPFDITTSCGTAAGSLANSMASTQATTLSQTLIQPN